MEHERGFDKAGDSCRLFRMADIGFDRADGAVMLAAGLFSKRHRQGFDFKRIANSSSRGVTLNIAHAVRTYPGRLQRIDDRLRLLAETRRGVAVLG